ncbi:hypothetical protein QYE76_045574 [Lolium multiflorum]|uniref:Uncharacterized protein n=1 Tax=Lolium multiflorum TaxID=4521 RepID=A0AAD8TLN4_LOLMU|nr:hypothetical protein QYE76_045574 [Lolium multiflorum]
MATAIGGWVASALITKLVEKMCSYAGDQYEYQRQDTKEKLRILEKNLSSIQTVMHIAERVQAKNTAMGSWLRRIKDAACQAEDVLDLFDYRVLQAEAEDMGKANSVASAAAGSSSSSTTTITTASTTTSSSSGSTVNQSVCALKRFLFSDEDIDELISVLDLFVDIDSTMQTFLGLVNLEDSIPKQAVQWRTTTSIPGSRKFFGRVNEEKHLKKLLVQINEQSSQPYDVISIVGIGGVVWLHVSDKFDVGRLTKEMAHSYSLGMSADLNSISSLDQAQRMLREKLNGKRALVVLDDVWNELSSQSENLCKPLQFACKGSKVIVTTRSKNVASINGATEMMHLHGLEDEEYWGYFSECAFGDANPSEYPQLENIGRQVVKRLAGSPLAAKTVGGSLKLELEENHWRAVSRRKLWQLEQKEDDIISALGLSYEHLPDHLKQCFVYFALFPKKYHLRGDVLIQMWRAHGFLSTQTPDEIAYRYINDLLQLSFIEKVANKEDHYVVHDLLHDFAESLSNGEHFRVEDDFHVCIPRNVRHIYVSASNISKVFMSLQEFKELKKNVRSLIICKAEGTSRRGIASSNFNHVLEETLQQLRSLRVLVLSNLDGILPKNLDKLVRLRYLNIHENGSFISVPKSIFKLYHLNGLNLNIQESGMMKKELQEGLSMLTQLRYLKAPKEIISGIELIGRLTSLRELEEYEVKSDMKHHICQLKELNELRGMLNIKNLQNVRCREESSEAGLVKKENLNKLTLCWNHHKHSMNYTDHEGVFEGLQPNPNLRELSVRRYMGINSPSWLSCKYLPNIHCIELFSCHHWKTLPPFGSLPFLRILKIRHLTAVENIDAGFYGDAAVVFPSLEKLLFEGMDKWKGWSGIDSSQQLSLDRLGLLFNCLPTSSLASVHMLDISSSHLEIFNMDQKVWLQQLTSLEELRFTDCLKLRSLPSNMMHLTSLESLYIETCPKLESFPQTGLPLSLKMLTVIKCRKTFSELCSEINTSTNNTIQQLGSGEKFLFLKDK